jgi:hypothetical protein
LGTIGLFVGRGLVELKLNLGANGGVILQMGRAWGLSRIIFQIPEASLEKSVLRVDFWEVEGMICKMVRFLEFWDLFLDRKVMD